MVTIRYVISSGNAPFFVDINCEGVESNIHFFPGVYEFASIPYGNYIITITDFLGCSTSFPVNATCEIICTLVGSMECIPFDCALSGSMECIPFECSLIGAIECNLPPKCALTGSIDCFTDAPYYRAAMYVGAESYNIDTEVLFPYVKDTQITLNTPIFEGVNYFFISIPQGDTFSVADMLLADVTSEFEFYGTQEVVNYYPNSVYRKRDVYDTTGSTVFYLTINS